MSRWTVTYTKHVKQKRKVYQDGVLELSSSGDKVSLYDDCEKLIDSRFLKKDEVVECGGMLAFETHLVDIGDPEISCISVTDLSAGGEDGELNERAGAQRQKYFQPFNLGNKKIKLQSLPSMNYPNTLHGSIRENKKSTMLNKSAKSLSDSNSIPSNDRVRKQSEHCSNEQPQLCPNETQKTLKEWNALYTTQITQKSKKYHDGILRLVSCNSNLHQVILLNEYETVLSTEYVNSPECVETGHNYKFSNYLVEICEPHIRPQDSQNEHTEQFPESINADDGRFADKSAKPIYGEWDVLYTAQITRKAKKYHDGILRLVNCASHLKQVVLSNEDGTVLSSKYLKSGECIKTGKTFEFPNYLVEICALRTLVEDAVPRELLSKVPCCSSTSSAKFTNARIDYTDKPLPKDSQYELKEQIRDFNNGDDGSFADNSARPKYDEWDVLYTDQITQKAKKYHDGILRLINCVSNIKQVVLLNEDGTVLSSKYLKSTGCVRTGLTYEFPNYLVEICAWRTHSGDDIPREFISKEECSGSMNTANFTNVMKDCKNKPLPKDIQKYNSKEVTDDVGSDSDMATSLNYRRIRDASQILSSLKRPVNLSRSSKVIIPDIECNSKIVEVDIPITLHSIKSTDNRHKGNEGVIDSYCHEKSPSNKYSISSNQLSGVLAPDIFPIELDMEDTNIKNGRIISSTGSHEVLDSNGWTFPKIIQTNSSVLLGERFSCTPVDSSDKCSSSSSSSPEHNIVADKNRSISDEIVALQQEWASLSNRVSTIGNTETPIRLLQDLSLPNERCETNQPLAAPSPVFVAIEATSDNSEIESISKTCLNVDECPTFDLGFD